MADPLFFAKALQYYKRREVQEAMLRHAQDREVSPRYGEGFGKRPDVLSYPQDILEFAKRKATSFHVSEERWENPLSIQTGMSRKDANDLRTGWDLVLDIDAKDWDISRMTAWLFIEVLKAHGLRSISCKFSGNKGWHVGVPFESFPPIVWDDNSGKDVPTKDLFPELPRAIATYIVDFISDEKNGILTISEDRVMFGWNEERTKIVDGMSPRKVILTLSELEQKTGKRKDELLTMFCTACNKTVGNEQEQYKLQCPVLDCHTSPKKYTREEKELVDPLELICPKCRTMMVFERIGRASCPHAALRNRPYQARFALAEVVQFDTILLASRHLYRMAYSLHEKSGLASVVIDPELVLDFDKRSADPKTISFERTFLDTSNTARGEATDLLMKAWRRQQEKEGEQHKRRQLAVMTVTEAIPEEHFPPCIANILSGLKDGKKRAMFALTNFLTSCGWNTEMVEKRLYEWNERSQAQHGEALREVIIKGHMHAVRMKTERILPPNCKSFYQELGVCRPNEFCGMIKNPGQYAIKHVQLGEKRKPAKEPNASKDSDSPPKPRARKPKAEPQEIKTPESPDSSVSAGGSENST